MNDFGEDPRRGANSEAMAYSGDEQPVVGGTARGIGSIGVVAVFAVLAVALFLYLNARRGGQPDSLITSSAGETAAASPPPPLDIAFRTAAAAPVPLPPPAPVVTAPAVPPPADDTTQRLHAPAVVVDLQGSRTMPAAGAAPTAAPASAGGPAAKLAPVDSGDAAPPAGGGAAGLVAGAAAASGSPLLAGASGGGGLGPNEQFAARASDAAPEPAVATQMTNLGKIITQGATIPAVLETAIISDLPGYTRAVVSRDVLGFDGKNVLIPRGSRVIGQYRSALSLGQSRVFVIWTRVIRPDGVTVQIGSPGDDALGRGGLTGDVNSHFFSRFGGAILLSVLNGGIAAIAGTPSTQISIGSPAAAVGAAATATVPTGSDILPTISVKQGAAVSIFVARDLDFSPVNPVK